MLGIASNEGSRIQRAIIDPIGIKIVATAAAWLSQIDECRIAQAQLKGGQILEVKALADSIFIKNDRK
ncbi:unnamed protein product [Hermetia illucens]|uniref:Uncharacterized protein n=1 Tax=Hermetia illucens TaxID=343691 RepID=A0A7R8UJS2_HERIL|nr:unnamed protein product [Hermetia illucens]